MLNINKAATVLGLGLVLLVGLSKPAAAQEVLPISAVTVVPARPGKVDVARLRKTLNISAATDQEIEAQHPLYVVKLFTRFLPAPAQVILSIGTTPVVPYGTFADGIFVRVYDPAQLRAWAGQRIKLVRRGPKGEEPAIDPSTLPVFPAAAAPAAAAPAAAAAAPEPPRKSVAEVLRSNN